MERDEQGREVRRRPPPARPDVDEGFPAFEHNQWTFEGEIERLGTFARGVNRPGKPAWVRVGGWVVAIAILLPLLMGVVSSFLHVLG